MENTETEFEGPGLEGTVLAGRYRVAQTVARGANTMLLDAIDIETDGQVSVKIVRPELARDDEFRRKFRRLAEVSNALTHPNIASVSDWGELDYDGESTVFWVVDALGGGSMRDLLDRGRLLEPGQALVVGLEACRALDAAHQKGLFHTEINPSKMVFGVDRRLRVVDFGMARLLAEDSWTDMSTVPTHVARYASPEQALGLPIDAKTDVYALALVLIEAVTGSVPFGADSTVATLAARVDKLMTVSADLGALASVLERAGRPEAPDRFTAAEFGRALVQIAPKMPKPKPIPIVATGLFDTAAMRRPVDPTGGIDRPPPVGELAGVDDSAPDGAVPPEITLVADADATPGDEAAATPDELVVSDIESDESVPEMAVEAEVASGLEAADDAELDSLGEHAVDEHAEAAPVTEAVDGVADLDLDEADRRADDVAVDDLRIIGDVAPVTGADGAEAEAGPDAQRDVAGPAGAAPAAELEPTELEPVDVPEPTEEMPATDVAAALAAGEETTDVQRVDVTAADPSSNNTTASGGTLYDEEAESQRRRKGPIVVMALLLIAGLAALGYAYTILQQPKSFEVPELAGVSEAQAMNQIAGNDWDIATTLERSDTFPEPDTVIRTDPGPGIDVEEGEPFTLVLSEGPEFRTLPELAELPFEAAVAQLTDLGLTGREAPEREFSEELPIGAVVSWSVVGDAESTLVAGEQILPGRQVEMTLSAGPEPRTVPNLSGATAEDATAQLDDLVLVLELGDEVFSDDVPAGQIVSQTPAAETSVERGATVTIQVSKGPDIVAFPELDGVSFTDAQAQLLDLGFEIGTLLGTTDGTFVEATIDGNDVTPGTEFRRGQVIDLIFL